MRAGVVGAPVHVHTGVRTSHFKNVWLAERDFWDWAVAPPAAAPTAVLVPVLGRPQNAEPFMRSLRASTGLATVYAIADAGDLETQDAWRNAGAHVVVWNNGQPGTFAEKVNYGYRHILVGERFAGRLVELGEKKYGPDAVPIPVSVADPEPWVFITGDDVQFHPGWLDHAQAMAGDRVHVVGTNDLGNPRVMAGEHATHLLIRRSYIDEQGASWDGPGTIAHEGYRHWFVDDEIVTAAKQRGVWAMALGSKVEHNHPYWGKGDHDDTYALGEKNRDRDANLWRGRRKAFA